MSRILIWSGGYDSTWILINEIVNNRNIDECWSFNFNRIDESKMKIEKERREQIISFLKLKGFETPKCREFDLNGLQDGIFNGNLPQQHIWAVLTSIMSDEKDVFLFGFHRKDHFWKISTNLNEVRVALNKSQNKDVKWEFPLESKDKYEIVMDILATPILNELVWTCELPILKNGEIFPCGECEPCINLETAKLEAKLRNYKGYSLLSINDDIIERKID